MPEIELTIPVTSIELTDEQQELEAMYAEICDLWSS